MEEFSQHARACGSLSHVRATASVLADLLREGLLTDRRLVRLPVLLQLEGAVGGLADTSVRAVQRSGTGRLRADQPHRDGRGPCGEQPLAGAQHDRVDEQPILVARSCCCNVLIRLLLPWTLISPSWRCLSAATP